jgi:omega-6 fatty acid desaturase (delta-12 desaturase)
VENHVISEAPAQMAQPDIVAARAPKRKWASRLASYRQSDNRRAFLELGLTLGLFFSAWAVTLFLFRLNPWLTPFGIVPAAGLLVRVFIIQHDCGHGAMFNGRRLNGWVGRLLGIMTFTPYYYWQHTHAVHHAHSGNLDRRGVGDVQTLTIKEYRARTVLGRWAYRALRHPSIMFFIGPAYVFLLQHRWPAQLERAGWRPWASVMGTNLAIGLMIFGLVSQIGWLAFLCVHVGIIVTTASIGVWLFFVQHQYEAAQWDRTRDWSHEAAALGGSSYYVLPKPLMWLTGYIGIHHVHHLASNIPFYRLPDVLKDFPELAQMSRLTFRESLTCARLKLWDEANRRLVTFREAHGQRLAGA